MTQYPHTKKYLPPIPNENLKPGIFQNPSELIEKTKRGSRSFRRVFQYKQTLNLPNFTSWQTCLNDASIVIADVNKSLHWLSQAEKNTI